MMRNITKTLLTLLVFGFSANGATYSYTGLEGIAKDGLDILIEGYSKIDKTFDKKAIENQVELKLRLAGIRVNKRAGNYIYVNARPHPMGVKTGGYAISIEAYRRDVTFEANNKQYRCDASVWHTGSITPADDLRDSINEHMDEFLLDYLKANPKKKDD